jgi:hypothetical protein
MEGTQSRVEKLKAKQAQLAEEIKKLEAREAQQSRKDDTRRKVIAGALALEHAEKNKTSEFAKKLMALLEEYVRPNERRLFTHLGIASKDSGKKETAQG